MAPVAGIYMPAGHRAHGHPLAGPKAPGTHVQLLREVAPATIVSELFGQELTPAKEHEEHTPLHCWAGHCCPSVNVPKRVEAAHAESTSL